MHDKGLITSRYQTNCENNLSKSTGTVSPLTIPEPSRKFQNPKPTAMMSGQQSRAYVNNGANLVSTHEKRNICIEIVKKLFKKSPV